MASAASPQTPSGGAGKLESLSKEDLIKFAKRQTMLLSKAKEKIAGMYNMIIPKLSLPLDLYQLVYNMFTLNKSLYIAASHGSLTIADTYIAYCVLGFFETVNLFYG